MQNRLALRNRLVPLPSLAPPVCDHAIALVFLATSIVIVGHSYGYTCGFTGEAGEDVLSGENENITATSPRGWTGVAGGSWWNMQPHGPLGMVGKFRDRV
jgi:hypothetical protein